jgi:hypothetical protein
MFSWLNASKLLFIISSYIEQATALLSADSDKHLKSAGAIKEQPSGDT